ncbi:MAG: hypothetical protein QOC92_777 [Acidimicrobiaceae bacterium]|jgi:hypothetical protein
MKPDDRLEVGTAASHLERDRPAEAVADRRHPIGVRDALREQDIESGEPEPPDACGVAHQRSKPFHGLLGG